MIGQLYTYKYWLQPNSNTPPMKSPSKLPHFFSPGMLPPPPPPPPNLARPVAILRTSDGQVMSSSPTPLTSSSSSKFYDSFITSRFVRGSIDVVVLPMSTIWTPIYAGVRGLNPELRQYVSRMPGPCRLRYRMYWVESTINQQLNYIVTVIVYFHLNEGWYVQQNCLNQLLFVDNISV